MLGRDRFKEGEDEGLIDGKACGICSGEAKSARN